MEQLTLEQAAEKYDTDNFGFVSDGPIIVAESKTKEWNINAFKAGAEWQKEQDKYLMHNTIKALLSVQKYLHYKEECDGRGLGESFPHPKHEVNAAIGNYLLATNETIDGIVTYK